MNARCEQIETCLDALIILFKAHAYVSEQKLCLLSFVAGGQIREGFSDFLSGQPQIAGGRVASGEFKPQLCAQPGIGYELYLAAQQCGSRIHEVDVDVDTGSGSKHGRALLLVEAVGRLDIIQYVQGGDIIMSPDFGLYEFEHYLYELLVGLGIANCVGQRAGGFGESLKLDAGLSEHEACFSEPAVAGVLREFDGGVKPFGGLFILFRFEIAASEPIGRLSLRVLTGVEIVKASVYFYSFIMQSEGHGCISEMERGGADDPGVGILHYQVGQILSCSGVISHAGLENTCVEQRERGQGVVRVSSDDELVLAEGRARLPGTIQHQSHGIVCVGDAMIAAISQCESSPYGDRFAGQQCLVFVKAGVLPGVVYEDVGAVESGYCSCAAGGDFCHELFGCIGDAHGYGRFSDIVVGGPGEVHAGGRCDSCENFFQRRIHSYGGPLESEVKMLMPVHTGLDGVGGEFSQSGLQQGIEILMLHGMHDLGAEAVGPKAAGQPVGMIVEEQDLAGDRLSGHEIGVGLEVLGESVFKGPDKCDGAVCPPSDLEELAVSVFDQSELVVGDGSYERGTALQGGCEKGAGLAAVGQVLDTLGLQQLEVVSEGFAGVGAGGQAVGQKCEDVKCLLIVAGVVKRFAGLP